MTDQCEECDAPLHDKDADECGCDECGGPHCKKHTHTIAIAVLNTKTNKVIVNKTLKVCQWCIDDIRNHYR